MRKFFQNLLIPPAPEMETSSFSNEERLQIATCVLLIEVARSDDDFSSVEKATVSAILQKKFDLSAEAVRELMALAKSRREESVDLWAFTNALAESYSEAERIRILEAVWEVVYADDKLDSYEDHFVHKLITLLRLEHQDLIEAKLNVLERKRK